MTDTNELLRDLERALVAISEPYRYEPTTSLPALSPQMQDALDAEAQMVARVLKRAREMEAEVQAARAEVERLRGIIDDIEVESGHCHFLDDEEHEPPHLPDHVRAIVQERDAARANLREAMELLRAHGQPPDWLKLGEAADWNTRYGKLLDKHKETP